MGDSRGHFDGDTLVVETEDRRFTPVDANTLDYQITIDDPKTWTRP